MLPRLDLAPFSIECVVLVSRDEVGLIIRVHVSAVEQLECHLGKPDAWLVEIDCRYNRTLWRSYFGAIIKDLVDDLAQTKYLDPEGLVRARQVIEMSRALLAGWDDETRRHVVRV